MMSRMFSIADKDRRRIKTVMGVILTVLISLIVVFAVALGVIHNKYTNSLN